MTRVLDACLITFSALSTTLVATADSVTDLLDPGDGSELVRVVVHKTQNPIGWIDASARATRAGGTLLAPTTTALNHQAANLASQFGDWDCVGPWLGVLRAPSTDSIDSGWTKSDQSPMVNLEWAADSPAGAPRLPWYVAFDARTSLDGRWINTVGDPYFGTQVYGLMIAFASDVADCDEDGFPDGFEIEFLDAPDEDGNGIPDECGSVIGDLDGDGFVNGIDLAMLLAAWATSSAAEDLDGDGVVGPEDLTYLLSAWTG